MLQVKGQTPVQGKKETPKRQAKNKFPDMSGADMPPELKALFQPEKGDKKVEPPHIVKNAPRAPVVNKENNEVTKPEEALNEALKLLLAPPGQSPLDALLVPGARRVPGIQPIRMTPPMMYRPMYRPMMAPRYQYGMYPMVRYRMPTG